MALNASVEEEGRGAGRRRMRVDYYFSFLSFGQLRHFFPLSLLLQKGSVNGWQLLRGNKKIKDRKALLALPKQMSWQLLYIISLDNIISCCCHAKTDNPDVSNVNSWCKGTHVRLSQPMWRYTESAHINYCPPIISLNNPYSIVLGNQFSWKRSLLMNDDRISLLTLILHKVICNGIVAHTFLSLSRWRRTYNFLSAIIYRIEAFGLMSCSRANHVFSAMLKHCDLDLFSFVFTRVMPNALKDFSWGNYALFPMLWLLQYVCELNVCLMLFALYNINILNN